MLDILAKGGWMIYPIFAGSVVGLALFCERLWALRKSQINPLDLLRPLSALIGKGHLTEARVLCQRDESALARIMMAALSQSDRDLSRSDLKDIVEEAGQKEAFLMERGVGALGVVASLEPLMGLLGTVLGLIAAFQKLETSGGGDPKLIAGGVWVALLTTALGLLIAIPAYIGYRFLLGSVDRKTMDLQTDVSLLLDTFLIERENRLAKEVSGAKEPAVSIPVLP